MKVISKTITETPRLGEGIYLTIDVSKILKLPYSRVKHMMKTFWHGHTFGEKWNKAVNFFALIEFYTYYKLREIGYTSNQIKALHQQLSHDLHTSYPFASIRVFEPKKKKKKGTDITNKKTNKSQIWYEYMGILMRGDRSRQTSINDFVGSFLKQIEFGDDLLAKRFYPLGKSKNVVVDPLHQFGQPVISGTNLQTKAIYALFDAGETKSNISKLYEISKAEINDAIRFHERKAA